MTLLINYFLIVNLLAAGLMAYDKLCAMKGRWRVPEASLFMLSLIGASPTVFFLTRYLRHKSRKSSFMRRIYVIFALQLLLLFVGAGVYLTNQG